MPQKYKFRISIQGLAIWSNFVATTEKELGSSSFLNEK